MGEAKRRGTRDQRKKQSIEKQQKETAALRKKLNDQIPGAIVTIERPRKMSKGLASLLIAATLATGDN